MNRSPLIALLVLSSTAAATPVQLSHQGRLLDSAGAPLEGAHTLDVALFAESAGGSALFSETLSTDLDNGFYAVTLGADSSAPLDHSVLEPGALWLEVSVDGGTALSPRLQLGVALDAAWAHAARSLAGGAVDATEISVNGQPLVDSQGVFVGAVAYSQITGAPVDEVATGADVDAFVEDGPLDLHADTTIGGQPFATNTDTLAELSCSEGQVAAWSEGDAAWMCAPALPDRSCADSEVLAWSADASDWSCAPALPDVGCSDGQHLGWDANSAAWVCEDPVDQSVVDSDLAVSGGLSLGAGGDCPDSADVGSLQYADGSLQICSEGGWSTLWAPVPDGSEDRPAESCRQLKADVPDAPSGSYFIQHNSTSFETWCDMDTDGGGWTLLVRLSTRDSGVDFTHDGAGWGGTPYGTYRESMVTNPGGSQDFVAPGYTTVEGRDVMVRQRVDSTQFAVYTDDGFLVNRTLSAILSPSIVTGGRACSASVVYMAGTPKHANYDELAFSADESGDTEPGRIALRNGCAGDSESLQLGYTRSGHGDNEVYSQGNHWSGFDSALIFVR